MPRPNFDCSEFVAIKLMACHEMEHSFNFRLTSSSLTIANDPGPTAQTSGTRPWESSLTSASNPINVCEGNTARVSYYEHNFETNEVGRPPETVENVEINSISSNETVRNAHR